MHRLLMVCMALIVLFGVVGEVHAWRPCEIHWSDEFAYGLPTRALNGNGGWSGSAGSEIAAWDNWCCVITGGAGNTDASLSGVNYYGVGNIVWIHLDILGYNDTSAATWNIWIDDEQGRNHAHLHGSCNWLVGKSGASSTTTESLTDRQFHDIDIKIDTEANTSDFYANGVLLGKLSYQNEQSGKIDRIRLERIDSEPAANKMLLIGDIYMGTEDISPPDRPYTPFSPASAESPTIEFRWPDGRDTCSGVAGYHVQIGTTPAGTDIANVWIGNTNSYSFQGDSSLTYYCRIAAKDRAGNQSEWSNVGASNPPVSPPVMQVDGDPFFPIGYYTSTGFSSDVQARDYFLQQRAQGMNTVLSCYGVWNSDSGMVNIMQGAALAGMKVAMEVNRYALRGDPGYPASLIDDQVDLLKDYPALLGWYLIDEPETQSILPSTLQDKYAQINSRDPNHSIWAVHYAYTGRHFPGRPALDYLAAEPPPYCDVLMTDTYPVDYGTPEFGGQLWLVATETRAHTDLSISTGKQAYINVAQVQGWQPFGTRLPTYPEQRYLLYAPVVEGARGLMLWMYNAYSTEDHLTNVVGPIAREISSLIPAIISDSTAFHVSSSHDSDTTGHGIGDVTYMICEDSRGGYLLAVNNTANALSVTFNLAGDVFSQHLPEQSTQAPVLFEGREVTAQYIGIPDERMVTDTFSPYDVNVYRIYTLGSTLSIDLGSPDMNDGISHPQVDDGDTVAVANLAGVNCRRNADAGGVPPDSFFYFAVDDEYVFNCSNPDLQITIRYHDSGVGALELQYDAISSAYKSGGSVALTGSGGWKTHTFSVTDAYFGNRQNSGADFRIVGSSGLTYYLDTVRVIPGEPAPPSPVAGFTAVPGSGTVTLNWTNPADLDFVGTMIRYKTGGYPSSPTDGALLCDRPAAPGSSDSFVHSGFDNIWYYYTAFSYDHGPLYAPAYASSSPLCGPVLEETFNEYAVGALGGQGSWTTAPMAPASAQVQADVAEGGSGKSALMDPASAGSGVGNQIAFNPRSQGYYYVSFDARQDSVGGVSSSIVGTVNIYPSDSSTEMLRIRIQKDRVVFDPATYTYYPIQPGTWHNIRVGINVDARTFDIWFDGSKDIEDYPWKGTGTGISRIVISSSRNTSFSVQKTYIDNLTMQPRPASIAEVRDEGNYTPNLSELRFSFDPLACAGAYRYCIGTTPGGSQVRGWRLCDAGDVEASNLSLVEGQQYFITAQTGSGGLWEEAVTSDGITAAVGAAILEAKTLGDGEVRALRGKTVSAVFSDCFYVQEPDKPFGIKVISSAAVNPGDTVSVAGAMRGAGAERYLDATGNPYTVTSPGPGVPGPLAMSNKDLGGNDLHPLAPGTLEGLGPNNIGLLVRCWGLVSNIDGTTYHISDGSGVTVKVQAPDVLSVPVDGAYVVVTGISLADASGNRLVRIPAPE